MLSPSWKTLFLSHKIVKFCSLFLSWLVIRLLYPLILVLACFMVSSSFSLFFFFVVFCQPAWTNCSPSVNSALHGSAIRSSLCSTWSAAGHHDKFNAVLKRQRRNTVGKEHNNKKRQKYSRGNTSWLTQQKWLKILVWRFLNAADLQ